MSLSSDLTAIKNLSDGVKNNKVTRFAYTQNAYNNNDVNGHSDYVYDRDNNIPTADLSVIEVNPTVVDKGFRARASSLTRMLLNHLFGRISYNLNKVNDLFNELLVKVLANLGVANGLATLDANGRIPYSQLPEDAMEYQGEWNAETNTPHLEDGTGTRGDTYNVSVAGTQNLGSGDITFFAGDRIVYNENGVWQRLVSGVVQSVAEIRPDQATGNVDLSKQSDITKILPASFINKLFQGNNGRAWTLGTGEKVYYYTMESPVYANGIWVAGSEHGMWWSTDGKAWTQGTGANTVYAMQSPVYANGVWVAGSTKHGMWWSTDGKNWTQSEAGKYGTMTPPVYVNNLWIAGSSGMSIGTSGYGMWWSEDGKNWSICYGLDTTYKVRSPVYANGIWVACSTNHGMWWSEDGKHWTQGTGGTSVSFNGVAYANGLWVAGGTESDMWWSTDGKAWTKGTGGLDHTMLSPIYANGIWVVSSVGVGIWWSTDGKNWTRGKGGNIIDETVRSIVCAYGLWVACSSSRGMWWSTDGKNWTQGTGENKTRCMNAVTYANGIWVASSYDYGMWRSEDGKAWTQGTGENTNVNMYTVVYANGLWVAGSEYSGIWWSRGLAPEYNGE